MNPVQFSDRIPALSLEVVTEALSHDAGRTKIKKIIDEYVGSVTFEELVMTYAGKEIDKRSLGTFKFWAITVLTAVISGIITSLIILSLTGKL